MCEVPDLGESLHVKGADGAQRAKTWLEKTGTVEVRFIRTELPEAEFLSFAKATAQSFSFDLGGILHLNSGRAQFYAEVKYYSGVGGQPAMYEEFLAQCYRATDLHKMPYHFMWITWHPFSITNWSSLCDAATIKSAVNARKAEYLNEDAVVDEELCDALADRLWLIVLSDKQETLSMPDEMLAELRKAQVLQAKT